VGSSLRLKKICVSGNYSSSFLFVGNSKPLRDHMGMPSHVNEVSMLGLNLTFFFLLRQLALHKDETTSLWWT
jgi:hypothetical protein